MTAFESGDTVGRYRILRPLGAGAMGVVYLAQDPQIERLLAIKTVRPAEGVLASSPQVAERHERLLREARTVGRLIHPNIVTLFDAGDQDGLLYLAFEYVDGPSLEQRLRAGEPVTTAEALRLARETAEGLAYAHARGVVHRDVKPANLLLAADGRIKISDFGIAKVVGQATELTLTGTVVGSPHYLSPEQVRGEDLDGRSDLFSLGVVLYELLGGRRPFEGETLTTLVYQILHQEPPPIELRPELAPEGGTQVGANLAETLARLLAKDREQRFADGHQVAAALAELESGLPAEVLAAPAVVPGDVAPTRLVILSGAMAAPAATRPGEVAGESAATRLPPGADPPRLRRPRRPRKWAPRGPPHRRRYPPLPPPAARVASSWPRASCSCSWRWVPGSQRSSVSGPGTGSRPPASPSSRPDRRPKRRPPRRRLRQRQLPSLRTRRAGRKERARPPPRRELFRRLGRRGVPASRRRPRRRGRSRPRSARRPGRRPAPRSPTGRAVRRAVRPPPEQRPLPRSPCASGRRSAKTRRCAARSIR